MVCTVGSGVPLDINVCSRTACSVGNPEILSPIKFKHLFSNMICASSLISSHLSKGDRLKYLPVVADAEPKRVFL